MSEIDILLGPDATQVLFVAPKESERVEPADEAKPLVVKAHTAPESMTDAEIRQLSEHDNELAVKALRQYITDKIRKGLSNA